MDSAILSALKDAETKEKLGVSMQVVAKTLQRAHFLGLTYALDTAETEHLSEKKKSSIQLAYEFYPGLKPTVQKRGKYVNVGDEFNRIINTSFDVLEKTSSDPFQFSVHKKKIIDTLLKVFALSVIYEIEELEKVQVKDIANAQIKLAEGATYYKILSPIMEKNNPRGHQIITDIFKGKIEDIKLALIKKELSTGLRGINLE